MTPFVSVFVAAELVRQLLQLAVVASHAAVAAVVVVGKQKLDGCLAGLQNTLGVCLYFHAVAVYGVNAGGRQGCARRRLPPRRRGRRLFR